MFHRFILYYGLYNLKPLIPCIAEELSMIGLCETPWNCVFSKKFPLRSWFLNSSKSKLTEASNQSPKGTLYTSNQRCAKLLPRDARHEQHHNHHHLIHLHDTFLLHKLVPIGRFGLWIFLCTFYLLMGDSFEFLP